MAGRNVPDLQAVFPKFLIFALPAVFIGFPLAVFIGWIHIKGSRAFSSKLDISVEANPYAYKLTLGFQEAIVPLCSKLLQLLTKISKDKNLLTAEEESDIADIQKKPRVLIQGGMVGTPGGGRLASLLSEA